MLKTKQTKTKQTALKSTGGSFPRSQLAAVVAKRRREEDDGSDLDEAGGKIVDYVCYQGKGKYMFKVENYPQRIMNEPEIGRLMDCLVLKFCSFNRGLKVTTRSAVWWGLMDTEEENTTLGGGEYTVRWVRFDPELGVDGERIKGGFLGKAGERSLPFPIRMFSLGGLRLGLKVPKEIQKLFEKCTTTHKGKWVEVGPLGSRQAASSESMAPFLLTRDSHLRYRSTEVGGCVAMAAANAVQAYDSDAAEKLSKCEGEISNLREFSKYVQDEVRTWTAEDPFRRHGRETSQTYLGSEERLKWVLDKKEGIFVVQPLIKNGGNSHIIGIDCAKKVIYDPLEPYMLKLQEEVMGLCAGGDTDQCRGIGDVRQLKPMEEPQAQGKRKGKTRRGRGGKKVQRLNKN